MARDLVYQHPLRPCALDRMQVTREDNFTIANTTAEEIRAALEARWFSRGIVLTRPACPVRAA